MEQAYSSLLAELRSLNMPIQDYAIFGSAPLVAHGLRADVHDLDVVARGGAWTLAQKLGTIEQPISGYGKMIRLFDGNIEIFDRWVSDRWSTDQLIESSEIIDGLPFVPLPIVLCWKVEANRPKDQQDILTLRRALRQTAPKE